MATTGPGMWIVQPSSQAWATAGSQAEVALNKSWIYDQQLQSTGSWTVNSSPTSSGYIFTSSGDGTTGTGNGTWALGRSVWIVQGSTNFFGPIASASFGAGITTVGLSSAFVTPTAGMSTGVAFTSVAAAISSGQFHFFPNQDLVYNLGSSALRWATGYLGTLIISGVNSNWQSNNALILDQGTASQSRITASRSGANNAALEIRALAAGVPNANQILLNADGSVTLGTGKIAQYNAVNTAGWGVPAINGYGRATAQTGANASVATYTVGAADGSFLVSANLNVTAFTGAGALALKCTYTDETNTARTLYFVSVKFGDANTTVLTTDSVNLTVGSTGYLSTTPMHIRCKASTTITILTSNFSGTYTYNVEGLIAQVA